MKERRFCFSHFCSRFVFFMMKFFFHSPIVLLCLDSFLFLVCASFLFMMFFFLLLSLLLSSSICFIATVLQAFETRKFVSIRFESWSSFLFCCCCCYCFFFSFFFLIEAKLLLEDWRKCSVEKSCTNICICIRL